MREELCVELNANTLAGEIWSCSELWLTISVLVAFPSFICINKNCFSKGSTKLVFILALQLSYACVLLLTNIENEL